MSGLDTREWDTREDGEPDSPLTIRHARGVRDDVMVKICVTDLSLGVEESDEHREVVGLQVGSETLTCVVDGDD